MAGAVSPVTFVECKNWNSPVGVPEMSIFESKMRDRGAVFKIVIFVAMAGFTQTALDRLKVPQRDLGVIYAITAKICGTLSPKRSV